MSLYTLTRRKQRPVARGRRSHDCDTVESVEREREGEGCEESLKECEVVCVCLDGVVCVCRTAET